MKTVLTDTFSCPKCFGILTATHTHLTCSACNSQIPTQGNCHFFQEVPKNIIPSQKGANNLESKEQNSCRRANESFYKEIGEKLPPDSVILDIGVGQGYFKSIFNHIQRITLDIYPYDEVDVVCDVTQNPVLRENCLDGIIMSNVLEHVADGYKLISCLSKGLKPQGKMYIAVPFIINLHQEPYDFVRYTHHGLKELMEANGMKVVSMEAVQTPFRLNFMLLDNLYSHFKPRPGLSGLFDKLRLFAYNQSAKLVHSLEHQYDPERQIINDMETDTKWITGYHLIAEKR